MMDFEPQSDCALNAEDQIRAYVHPTRMVILEMLADEKLSVSSLARRLETHPANITHHVKLLEKTGLIRLVEKRETGRNLEKLYRAIAYHFTVAPSQTTHNSKSSLALSILRDNLTSAIRDLQSQPDDDENAPLVMGALNSLQLTPENLQEFIENLTALVDEFNRRSSADGLPYCLNISIYPEKTSGASRQEVYIR